MSDQKWQGTSDSGRPSVLRSRWSVYWRCVWVNKASLFSYGGSFVSLSILFWLKGNHSSIHEDSFEPLVVFGITILLISVILGVSTRMGQATVEAYHKAYRHIRNTSHTCCDALSKLRRKYCWRVGLKMALDDCRSDGFLH